MAASLLRPITRADISIAPAATEVMLCRPAGTLWLTAGTAQLRLATAGRIAGLAAEATIGQLTPESMATLLSVPTWTNRTYAGLKHARIPIFVGLNAPATLIMPPFRSVTFPARVPLNVRL